MANLFQGQKKTPLAERMRPRVLEEVQGQPHLIGPNKPLSQLSKSLPSLILWGPPGCGKTTIARLLAGDKPQLSAVLSGVNELRKLVDQAQANEEQTVIFIDEIHRWNKAQQDALLPYVEDGTIILIGATTENPSFTLINPLMSRCKLFVLNALSDSAIKSILRRAWIDKEHGLGSYRCTIEEGAWDVLVSIASGDARRGLGALEIVAEINTNITVDSLNEIFSKKTIYYDRKGDQHYDCISAFIKSMRGSDPDASIYYLARMYEAGEDPQFLARRMIIFASEDVGNADPRALQVAVSGAEAFHRVGAPEGWIPLSQVAIYLATAPKSNASYMAYKKAKIDVELKGNIPFHLRNAPTKMMKDLGYGKGYVYAHNEVDGRVEHHHLPKELEGSVYYIPTDRGYEKRIKERMDWLKGR